MQETNFYVTPTLDRVSLNRRDDAWLAHRMAEPESRLLLVWRGQNLILEAPPPAAALLSLSEGSALLAEAREIALLGLVGERALFAADLSHREEPPALPGARFADLRSVGPLLAREEGGLLGLCPRAHALASAPPLLRRLRQPDGKPRGRAYAPLHQPGLRCRASSAHRPRRHHAGRASGPHPAGTPEAMAGGNAFGAGGLRRAGREPGGRGPARGRRGSRAPPRPRSHYHSSQPWPFPASIMLGFTAIAEGDQFRSMSMSWRWPAGSPARSCWPRRRTRPSACRGAIPSPGDWSMTGSPVGV